MKRVMQRASTVTMVLISTFLFLGSGIVQAQLIEDFDGGGTTAFTLTNSSGSPPAIWLAGPTGNFIRLANLNSSNNNSIAFDENPTVSGPMPLGFQLIFDFRMSDDAANASAGGCCGSAADGLGIGIFSTATYGASGGSNPSTGGPTKVWEDPQFADAFAVGLDIFQSIDIVTLNWNGAQVGSADVQAFLDLNDGLFHRVVVTVSPSGNSALVDMTIIEDVNGAAVSHDVYTDWFVAGMDLATLFPFRLIAGGRTGGAFHEGDIDNINLSASTAIPVIPQVPIPTIGTWGVIAMTLLLLLAGRKFIARKVR